MVSLGVTTEAPSDQKMFPDPFQRNTQDSVYPVILGINSTSKLLCQLRPAILKVGTELCQAHLGACKKCTTS